MVSYEHMLQSVFSLKTLFAEYVMLTWGEDVGVETNVERRVADGANCLASIEDNLAAFGICL